MFGLYIGVIKYHEISSEDLHRWRTAGLLANKIIELFSALPERSRGGYYPWFLRNRHVLQEGYEATRDEDNVMALVEKMLANARRYLEPDDRNVPVQYLTPFAKNYCFHFLALLASGQHPPPSMRYFDLWYDLGFAVCSDQHEESALAHFYKLLLLGNQPARDHFDSLGILQSWDTARFLREIPTCSFQDFWRAWEAGSLMDLFDRYGTSQGGASYGQSLDSRFPALSGFLSYPGKHPRPSIWRLRQYLAIEGANILTLDAEIATAAIEYGFHPSLDVRTTMGLQDFYTGIFKRRVLPADVQAVAAERRLHELADVVSGTEVDEGVKEVLRGVLYGTALNPMTTEDLERDSQRNDCVCGGDGGIENAISSEHQYGEENEASGRAAETTQTSGWCSIL